MAEFDAQGYEKDEFQVSSAVPAEKPLFVRMLLATGIVSSVRAAEYVLIGIAAFGILVTMYVFLVQGAPPKQISDKIPSYVPQ